MKRNYNSFSSFLKKKFPGKKIRKIPVNAGFACPNKTGPISYKGCIFCDEYGSGPIRTFKESIAYQIESFIDSHPGNHFIAYYQANSNTFAPVDLLKQKYDIALQYEKVVGLFIGTRPDTIREEAYPLLNSINKRTYLTVELGLQSIHRKSLMFLNRNHSYEDFHTSFHKLKNLNIDVVVHLIIGIPGETLEDMRNTIRQINMLKPAGIKLHLLHVLKDTELFEMYKRGEIKLLEMDEYTDIIVDLIELTDPDIVIHRLTGERDREIFVAPEWALDKNRVITMINGKLESSDSCQGKKYIDMK